MSGIQQDTNGGLESTTPTVSFGAEKANLGTISSEAELYQRAVNNTIEQAMLQMTRFCSYSFIATEYKLVD